MPGLGLLSVLVVSLCGTQPVGVVLPVNEKTTSATELLAAKHTAQPIVSMLAELGIESRTFDEIKVAHGALNGCSVAILPNNPTVDVACVAALQRFCESGGKLFICYSLPPRLSETLGFGRAKYVKQKRPGQFAEMRFDAKDILGLPPSVRQASWNITAVEPIGHHARVIASWYDDAKQPTGLQAILLSDRGAFLSHVVLADDAQQKKKLLAAVLGHLAPSLWNDMAKVAIRNASSVGHCKTTEEMASYWKSATGDEKTLAAAQETLQSAEKALAAGRAFEAFESAKRARESLVDAYLRTVPSRTPEGRGVWNHSGTGAYPGDWERSAKLLADNGFNMIFPNMLWGGLAHYASDVLPRSEVFRKYGDQVAQCCEAAHRHGIEVHVWKVSFNLSTAPKDFIETMRREGRTQVTAKGKPADWLCPSHPENRKLELDSLLEVARKYPIDGLHFDYIRYPDGSHCYCDGCRKRFEAETGRKIDDADWPKACFSGERKQEYRDWRCRQITALVEAVRQEARKIRPALKISAAVFGGYPDCRKSVGQDWAAWVKAGYVDFLCPMDYSIDDNEFVALVQKQLELVEGRIPLYPGIGATATGIHMTPDRVMGQIHLARSLGAAGWTVFNFDANTAATIVPGVGLGAGRQKAAIPHQTH
jgi:uncharacterized lipoprotein YddW (UPF0748 family)